jgi:hypothetical protein
MGQGSPLVRDCPWTAHSMRHSGLFGLLVFGVALVGCSSASRSLPHVAVQPPINTALSWFRSINEHNMPLALAHFVPKDRQQMEWSDFGSASFSEIRCQLVSQEKTTSEVDCTFHVPNPSPDMRGVTFWDIYMQREPPGPWLINAYGQG